MNKLFPNSPLIFVARRISPRTTIPLILAIANGYNRYSQLAETFPMSSRTLAKSIKVMETENMIKKCDDGTYELTQKGLEFSKHAKQMMRWFRKYYQDELKHCEFMY